MSINQKMTSTSQGARQCSDTSVMRSLTAILLEISNLLLSVTVK